MTLVSIGKGLVLKGSILNIEQKQVELDLFIPTANGLISTCVKVAEVFGLTSRDSPFQVLPWACTVQVYKDDLL